MYSLVRFENEKYSIVSSKQITFIENSENVYTSRTGKKSNVQSIESSDSVQILKKCLKELEVTKMNSSLDKSSHTTQPPHSSTPIYPDKLPKLEIRLSDIKLSNRSTGEKSCSTETSCPRSIPSELLELMGDDWLDNSSEVVDKQTLPDMNKNISETEHSELKIREKSATVLSHDSNQQSEHVDYPENDGSSFISNNSDCLHIDVGRNSENDLNNNQTDQGQDEGSIIVSCSDNHQYLNTYNNPTANSENILFQDLPNDNSNHISSNVNEENINNPSDSSRKSQNSNVDDFVMNNYSITRPQNLNTYNNLTGYSKKILFQDFPNDDSNHISSDIDEQNINDSSNPSSKSHNSNVDDPVMNNCSITSNDRHDTEPRCIETNISQSNTERSDSNYNPNSTVNSHDTTVPETSSNKSNKSSFLTVDDIDPFDPRNLKLQQSQPKNDEKKSKRLPSKQYFCLYCNKMTTKFARHLEQYHKDEDDVKKFLRFPKKSKSRLEAIAKIRNEATFKHNTRKELNTGVLLTSRRCQPKYNREVDDYVPCSHCGNYYSKQTLRIHYKRCNKNHNKGVHDILSMSRKKAGYIHERANDQLRRSIFPVMNDDDIKKVIIYDEIIIVFGNYLCEKYPHFRHYNMIRADLKYLGKHKLALMELNKDIKEYKSIFHPKHIEIVLTALKSVSHWNPKTATYKTPAVATRMTALIKKVAFRFKSECIKNEDKINQQHVENFIDLWKEEIQLLVNKKALEDYSLNKSQKKQVLPNKEDIKKLYDYLKNLCDNAMAVLNRQFDYNAWKELTEGTLILLQIFNRRRPGDTESLTINDFQKQDIVGKNIDTELFQQLGKSSQELAKKFVRITCRGKLGRPVSMLVHQYILKYIDMIIKYRGKAGAKDTNEYLFCEPNASALQYPYKRACPLISKFALACGAKVPSSLRGTKLRKHVATFTAMIGIEESDVERLASFMGHHQDIHKKVYRMPVPLAEMTKVAHLLEVAMGDDKDDDDEDSDDDDGYNENSDVEDMDDEKLLSSNNEERESTECHHDDNIPINDSFENFSPSPSTSSGKKGQQKSKNVEKKSYQRLIINTDDDSTSSDNHASDVDKNNLKKRKRTSDVSYESDIDTNLSSPDTHNYAANSKTKKKSKRQSHVTFNFDIDKNPTSSNAHRQIVDKKNINNHKKNSYKASGIKSYSNSSTSKAHNDSAGQHKLKKSKAESHEKPRRNSDEDTAQSGRKTYTAWTDQERNAVIKYFGNPESLSKVPSLKECAKAIEKYSVLRRRKPIHIRLHIDNKRRAEQRRKEYARSKNVRK